MGAQPVIAFLRHWSNLECMIRIALLMMALALGAEGLVSLQAATANSWPMFREIPRNAV